MHENGQRLRTLQYRTNSDGDEVMIYKAEVERFSFLQAGGHLVKANNGVTIKVSGFSSSDDTSASRSCCSHSLLMYVACKDH